MTTENIKQIIVSIAFMSLVLSSVATAAQDDEQSVEKNTQPYVIASNSVAGSIGLEEFAKPAIIQDTFLAAVHTPERNRVIRHNPQVTARTMYVTSTGYNSLPEQTDDSPFIAADGSHVYWGMVAANFLPFGTRIKIPQYYGDQIFVVHDRMNQRYWERVDVWFPEYNQAIQWGNRTIEIEILGS